MTRRTATASPIATTFGHIKLGAVFQGILTNGGLHLRTACAYSEKALSGVVKNLYFNTVAAYAKLIQRELNRFIDSDSLCFDQIGHSDQGSPKPSNGSSSTVAQSTSCCWQTSKEPVLTEN